MFCHTSPFMKPFAKGNEGAPPDARAERERCEHVATGLSLKESENDACTPSSPRTFA